MKSKLFLHGPLGEKFGKAHVFAVDSLTDCIVMLQTTFSKGEIIEEFSKYKLELIRNDKPMHPDNVKLNYMKESEFHLIPAVEGAGGKGFFNMILGAALMVVAFYIPPAGALGYGIFTASSVGMLGAGLFLSGLSATLTKPQDYSDRNNVDDRPSYLFNSGPVNVTEQGATIPLGFGEFFCGSVVIASELENEVE